MKLMKLMSEARFLAGEDARGVLVILEPETDLSNVHLDALRDCGAAGFVSDGSPAFFERPDDPPVLVYDRTRQAPLLAFAVAPRLGVKLRTWAAKNDPAFRVRIEDDGTLTPVPPPVAPKRDRSHDPEITKDEIVAKLRELGVRAGDTLMVHSSLSACGHIVGGAQTIIEALVEAVGPEGNFFVPTFQRSECYLNGINKRWDHRPSDVRDRASEAVRWVGTLPLEFMRLYPDAPRGLHISHSWAGWGPRAAEILSHQAEDEPPFSDNSCPMVVKDLGGRILHFGSPIGHTSFVHCLETHYDLPGLGPSYYDVRLPDGTITWKYVPKGLPGPREFYSKDENARLFREAVARGLEIRREPLGVGELKLLDCRPFWEIGSALVTADPRIVIGDL